MENQIFLDKDADLGALKNKKVAIIGYGIQGRPQALCMRDSGLDLLIGIGSPDRPSWSAAVEDGFEPISIAEAYNRNDWHIVVFGAGHVSQALIRLLLTLDCRVTCLDSRSQWLDRLMTIID